MGILPRGILGGFSGLVGTVVGSRWRDRDTIRAKPMFKKSRTATESQEIVRLKFSVVSKILTSMSALISIAFSERDGKPSHNSALKYTLDNAMIGEYPDFAIDFTKFLVSSGKLPLTIVQPALAEGQSIRFQWNPQVHSNLLPDDRAILVAYHAPTNRTYYTIGSNIRSEGTSLLELGGLSGAEVETWLGFISRDGKRVANSTYTGKVAIP